MKSFSQLVFYRFDRIGGLLTLFPSVFFFFLLPSSKTKQNKGKLIVLCDTYLKGHWLLVMNLAFLI